MNNLMIQEKEVLRQKLLKRLFCLTHDEIERRSNRVEKIISEIPFYKNAETIMVYYPLKGEVNLLGMIRKAFETKKVCFPVIDHRNKNLIPYRVGDLQNDFQKGPYSVMQPDPTKTEAIGLQALDLILVPGIAFDRDKNRLGRGGGYYDRLIKALNPRTRTLGIAFDFQIVTDLPITIPVDQKVAYIATEHEYF